MVPSEVDRNSRPKVGAKLRGESTAIVAATVSESVLELLNAGVPNSVFVVCLVGRASAFVSGCARDYRVSGGMYG